MKYIICIGILMMVTACGGEPEPQIITRDKLVVVDVPSNLYTCPVVAKFPAIATMTDIDVARLIVQLHRNNVTCSNSMEAIKAYLAESKKMLEKSAP